ncbi:hypothetical protein BDE36_1610 [Arcticibacter tournemirensis]|nr:hypothetical protein BDE36_1610 [Arcticibacter tournemirensis]
MHLMSIAEHHMYETVQRKRYFGQNEEFQAIYTLNPKTYNLQLTTYNLLLTTYYLQLKASQIL